MNILNLDQSKVITDKANSYFKNNRFMIGTSIPTEGSYNLGDIIINTSETSLQEPMWICIESGEPGVWQVTGAGNSSSRAICVRNQVVVDSAVSEVELGLGAFSKATDTLLVFINADYAYENVDYIISGNKIVAVDGKWNKVCMNDFTFDFIMFKSVSTENISSTTEIVSFQNYIVLEADTNEIEVGIENFISDIDLLTVYKNSVFLTENKDYTVTENKIINTNGNWVKGDFFSFIVLKQVAKLYPNAVVTSDHIVDSSITFNKLSAEVRLAINNSTGTDVESINLTTAQITTSDGTNLQTSLETTWDWIENTEDWLDRVEQKVGYDTLLTESKDLTGAVNELFQSANNGKELIASAIGEPLNSEDTFSAMSTDINSLLSTFKTNMMNNGITVESGDRFKSLIDKISTMVEEGSGKGIQFASGIHNISGSSTNNDFVITNLTFKPDIILVDYYYTSAGLDLHHVHMYNRFIDEDNYFVLGDWESSLYYRRALSDTYYINETGFCLSGLYLPLNKDINWFAIGVGEEDTTLRDSLASILTEEGVSVTEEDDMASLITKVDEEFDNINGELANALIDKGVKLEGNESIDELIQKIINDMSSIIYSGTQYTLVSGESTGYTATNSTAYVSNNVTIPTLPTGIIKNFRLNMSVTHTNRLGTATTNTGYIQVYIERNSEIIEYIYDNAGPQSTTYQESTYNYDINNIQENDKIYYRVKSTTSNDIYTYAITSVTITYDIFEV